MYRSLGRVVIRIWPALLAGWLIALAALLVMRPAWEDVIEEGEFAFLPADMPSLEGERLYEDAFGKPFASNIVIVVRRQRTRLDDRDRDFVTDVLKPRLARILADVGMPEPETTSSGPVENPTDEEADEVSPEAKAARQIMTFRSAGWQQILDSADRTATMVVIDLKTEFFNAKNGDLIDAIENLIDRETGELYRGANDDGEPLVPPGLDLALSGSATVGRDLIVAGNESSQATELWTVILVVTLLLLIYRAPVLAIIPLMTVAVATEFSLSLLSILAEHGVVGLFNGIEVYVKVLCYGAGVDYCLFLIARFKEELDDGLEPGDAVSNAIAKVGEALVASAGTVICGIGMMVFADFGKFRQAGVGISIGLIIVLLAALTFTPTLLRLFGRRSFWPHLASGRATNVGGWVSATGIMAWLLRKNILESIWQKTSEVIQRRPAFVLMLSTALMFPFFVVAIVCFDNLSYGLLTELPRDKASVQGAKAIQHHYPAGIAGPVTLLLHSPGLDFESDEDQELLRKLVDSLYERKDELQLADIRSVVHPFGVNSEPAASDGESENSETPDGIASADPPETGNGGGALSNFLNRMRSAAEQKFEDHLINAHYVGQHGEYEGALTRIDFVSNEDPFSRDSIRQFVELKETVLATAQELIRNSTGESGQSVSESGVGAAAGPTVYAIGPTASIRDLKTVTDRDQRVVDSLVLAGVFLILIALLRQFIIPVYLIVSVFFSYMVTLGVTFALFWCLDPSGFSGLDWKVPTFLFTILIAVGEDYNIFLMTRVREEQIQHGTIAGVGIALTKTGSIISSCGVIMAGTFASLLAGTLAGMHQLGFALAFGVLLDTFVVRPILVPAFLVLLYQGRFRALGIRLGTDSTPQTVNETDNPPLEAPGKA